MAQKSKFFRVAVEGATTDGRNIERSWIEQMARNYDPKKYGARIWLEHMRGFHPDSTFRAYGDVSAVKSEEVEIDGKRRLALFAQIEPLPDLVKMTTKDKQKIYSSIEINPKFADTGECYLIGLGVTDSPASLGTEILSFAAQHPDSNPFNSRKKDPGNLFSEAIEVTLEFEADDDAGNSSMLKGLRDAVAKFTGRNKRTDSDVAELTGHMQALAEGAAQLADAFADESKAHAKTKKELGELRSEFNAIKVKVDAIDTTDAGKFQQRPPATGADPKVILSDC